MITTYFENVISIFDTEGREYRFSCYKRGNTKIKYVVFENLLNSRRISPPVTFFGEAAINIEEDFVVTIHVKEWLSPVIRVFSEYGSKRFRYDDNSEEWINI